MMNLLSKYNLFGNSFLSFFKYSLIIFFSVYSFSAFSQSKDDVKGESQAKIKKTNIKVSQLTKPSLGSLGIKTEINNFMGLKVWENLEAKDISESINYIPDVITSRSMQFFLNEMYLSASNPPIGTTENIVKFLETRLLKIKSSGHSKKLYQLVKQLPDGKRWDIWKKWQVEFELFNIKDKEACDYINEKSKNTPEDFWQMGRIFCLIIDEKKDQSQFVLDLIKARGFSNQIFEDLFRYINNDKTIINFENKASQIEPLHIIIMESLKLPIKVNYIAHLGIEYTDSLLSLNYLTPKARSFILDKKMTYSDIPVETIIENYKSVADGQIDITTTLTNFSKEPNGYNRANVWLSIITLKDDLIKAQSILDVVKLETKNGRLNEAIKLYLPILKQIDSSALTKDIIDTIEKLNVVADPKAFPENNLANMIMLKKGYEWDWSYISKTNAWNLIPIVEKAGMMEPMSINWFEYINTINNDNVENEIFSKWDGSQNVKKFILTKSITQASESDQKTLTVLLIARLISDTPLIDLDLNNLLVIRSALSKIGLEDLGNNITYEVMSSKLINF